MNAPQPKAELRVFLIQLDQIELALPQSNLHRVESVLDICREADGGALGYAELHGKKWPVYCPADSLDLMSEPEAARRICAMLVAGTGFFGVICREVTSIEASRLRAFDLPGCMRSTDTPLHGIGMHDKRVVCLTSSQSLLKYFAVHTGSDDGNAAGIHEGTSDRTAERNAEARA